MERIAAGRLPAETGKKSSVPLTASWPADEASVEAARDTKLVYECDSSHMKKWSPLMFGIAVTVLPAPKELAGPVKELCRKPGMDIFGFGMSAIPSGSSGCSGVRKERPGCTTLVDVVELAAV